MLGSVLREQVRGNMCKSELLSMVCDDNGEWINGRSRRNNIHRYTSEQVNERNQS